MEKHIEHLESLKKSMKEQENYLSKVNEFTLELLTWNYKIQWKISIYEKTIKVNHILKQN
jgi:hypothetical protein